MSSEGSGAPKSMLQTDTVKLDSWQKEILKRWQGKTAKGLPLSVKDELLRQFDGEVLFDEPMAKHTYIKIGGPADVFLKPNSLTAVQHALRLASAHDIPFHFHGSGANTLVRDGGIRGMVICPYDALKAFSVVEQTEDHVDIEAEAGVPWVKLVHLSRDLGVSGLEPLTGIPGSLGGLIAMNAGTREREMKDIVREVTLLDKSGELTTLPREKLDFEYRHLRITRTQFIVRATLRLEPFTSTSDVDSAIKRYQERRIETQPLDFPNLGSMFKNPVPKSARDLVAPAGRLIEEAGLKNVRVGGARISSKHANFIINEGSATARDVIALINLAKDRVRDMTGTVLETEVKIIGEDNDAH